MPTVVRFVSKVALFILVITVSGIGPTQAQTDPTPTPSDGGVSEAYGDIVKYDREESADVLTPEVTANITWLFYGIEGYSDRFFVVADGSAQIRDYPSRLTSSINSFTISVGTLSRRTSLVRWEPTSFTPLSNNDQNINLGVTLKGVTTGFKIPLLGQEGAVQPYPLNGGRGGVDGGDEYRLKWTGQSWDKTVRVQFVTYWEGNISDVNVDFCGTYKETPVSDQYEWGNCGSGGT